MPNKQQAWLTPEEQTRITDAIARAEQASTGEIRVYIEEDCPTEDAIDRAKELFLSVGMEKTERRNAVLLYLAYAHRKFAIIGDQGIDEKAGGHSFWRAAADELRSHLKRGQKAEGLVRCIDRISEVLATHFPLDGTDSGNELSNDIIFGQ